MRVYVNVLSSIGFLVAPAAFAAETRADENTVKPRKVVLIAGKKSHGPGHHEYEKGCRLLKHCLEMSPNVSRVRAEVHTNGWPKDPTTLDDADTIVMFSDGSDHDESRHPILHGDRLATIGKLMKRGVGFVAIHYTVFVSSKRGGPQFLDWIGGYFDYESGTGPRKWYSKIKTATTTPRPATIEHPISRGLRPFRLREEYYYNMRFRKSDPRLAPILTTPIPGEKNEQVVAWAVQRKDGGRGFGFTGGHFHDNWQVDQFRKMVLNAILWTAKVEVPAGGVESTLPATTKQRAKPAEPIRAIIVTGHQHPAHNWRETTKALLDALWGDQRFATTVVFDPEFMAKKELHAYDLVLLNYCNWKRDGLSEQAKFNLMQFIRQGKGLCLIHYSNGSFREWPQYRLLSRRVWVDGTSGHDRYGKFRVTVSHKDHPITKGMKSWETIDELYYKQGGDLPIIPLATARSKVTGKDEPMAFVYDHGKGRIFQTVLGHAAESIRVPGTAELIRRGCVWLARRPQTAIDKSDKKTGSARPE